MGTFKIKAIDSPVEAAPNGLTWRRVQAGPVYDTNVVDAINSNDATKLLFAGTSTLGEDSVGSWSIRFHCIGASIELDGAGPLIAFNDLPAGFKATAAQLSLLIAITPTGSTNNRFLQHDQLSEQAFADSASATVTFPYNFVPSPKPTMLDIVNNGFGIRFAQTNTNGFLTFKPAAAAGGFPITGTYDIENFSYTVDGGLVGDPVTITATDSLDEVDSITLVYEDPVTGELIDVEIDDSAFDTQTATVIIFILLQIYLPLDFEGPVTIIGNGNGVQFSGSVVLGSFTVLIADGSGMYRIVTNKRNDTLYVSSHGGDETEDVAIPNPSAKTGLIGG